MEDTEQGQGRRISRRNRQGFAFSSSGLSDSSTGGGVAGDDEDLNAEVESLAALPPPRVSPPQSSGRVEAGNPSEDFNPRDRLRQVRGRASEYEKEYRLGLLHRLMMRRIPMDEIADQLGLSIAQVYRDREELKRKLRVEASGLDIDEMIGDSKGYYEEISAMSMRAASNANLPMAMRLAAMRTALASKNDEHRFFQTAGVYDVLRFKVAQDGTGISDVRKLMENTERILSGETLKFSNKADSGDEENIEL